MNGPGRVFIIAGAVLLALGVLLNLGLGNLGLGRLPGDIVLRRGNLVFYLPLATGILLSLLLSLAFAIFRR